MPAPSGLSATLADGTFTITWSPVDGAARYEAQHRIEGSDDEWASLPATDGTNSTFSPEGGPACGSTYEFRVRSYGDGPPVDTDETCPGGAAGCANVKTRNEREIYRGRIRIHTREDREGEFDGLSALEQGRVRGSMIHESIHALSWMQHRTEPASIMEADLNPRAALSPMDEALLRLYGHPLVQPATTP